jgi:hypothetical protein
MIFAVLLVSTVPLAGLLTGAEVTGKVCSAYSFEMDQGFSNSGGVVNRFIGISDPWSGGYLYEDLTVVGSASITDSFTMDNLGPGTNEDIFNVGDDHNLGFGTGDLYDFDDDIFNFTGGNAADFALDDYFSNSSKTIPTWLDLF